MKNYREASGTCRFYRCRTWSVDTDGTITIGDEDDGEKYVDLSVAGAEKAIEILQQYVQKSKRGDDNVQ